MTRQRFVAVACLLLSLTGAAARAVETPIAVSAIAVDLGTVSVGATNFAAVTLTNTGGVPFGPINLFGGSPPTAEFSAAQNCQAQTLPPGGSCQITYSFTPSGGGRFDDVSSFTVSATPSQSDGEDVLVALTGVGSLCIVCGPLGDLPDFVIGDPGLTPDPGSTTPEPDSELTGTAKLKGKGVKVRQPYALQLSFDTAAGTFLAMDAGGAVYTGHLVAKGKKGKKLRLFLDDASQAGLANDVATRAAAASGRSAGAVLGKTSKLVLKIGKDGALTLRVKLELLDSALGEIVLEANLASAPAEE